MKNSRWYFHLLFLSFTAFGMNNNDFHALVSSIRAGEFQNTRLLFSNCRMIWPNQLKELLDTINATNLRNADSLLYHQLDAFVEIYSDALSGKLQCNNYYLNCFKQK